MFVLIPLLCVVGMAWANTETYTFQIPNYYNIPPHIDQNTHTDIVRINDTALLLRDHPVLTIDAYSTDTLVLTVPYNFTRKSPQTLFVRLNNYNNSVFDSNDLINVKLCWPATTPIGFSLSHRFIQEREFGGVEVGSSALDMYIVVDFEGDFFAVTPIKNTSFDILLAVSKLPNRVPIPIELYDVIVYVFDVLILIASAMLSLAKTGYTFDPFGWF